MTGKTKPIRPSGSVGAVGAEAGGNKAWVQYRQLTALVREAEYLLAIAMRTQAEAIDARLAARQTQNDAVELRAKSANLRRIVSDARAA